MIKNQKSTRQLADKFRISNFLFNFGFTIIELLVSITILLIIIGLTLAGYSNFSRRQSLISAGLFMKNIIRDVQSRAFNGELDCDACDCAVASSFSLKGWYVDFSNRQIYGECTSATNPFPTITFFPQSIDFDTQITIAPNFSPTGAKIMFHYYPSGSDRSGTICLSQSSLSNKYYKITINSAGVISSEKNLVDTCP